MALKAGLQLRMGQQLALTPQLQQAIRLLQLSNVELELEVQDALERNPMLEMAEDGGADDRGNGAEAGEAGEAGEAASLTRDGDDGLNDVHGLREDPFAAEPLGAEPERDEGLDNGPSERLETQEEPFAAEPLGAEPGREAPDDAAEADPAAALDKLDLSWDSLYDADGSTSYSRGDDGEEGRTLEHYLGSGPPDLHSLLDEAVRLTPMSDADRLIAEAIIDAIDADGFLSESVEALAETLQTELDEVEAMLHLVQKLAPTGVGARDLRESLLLQLDEWDEHPAWELACQLVREHFEDLTPRLQDRVRKKLGVAPAAFDAALALIRRLNPRPGAAWQPPEDNGVKPDVLVQRDENGLWRVELNPEACPRVRVNHLYAGMAERARRDASGTYLRQSLTEARWLIKSLESRSLTILRVAQLIVSRQQGFLDQGEAAMQPLVLREIAEPLGLHESTVSRVTNQKFMLTPRGLFEFKYFFSSHVSGSDGEDVSATAIRAMIKELVQQEDPRKPLSDQQLAGVLGERGIQVARRTVAKYRESIGIASSSERRRP